MSRRNPQDKIVPLNAHQGKKERLGPEAALKRLRSMRPVVSQTHLLPVKLPYPDAAAMLANVPKHPLGIEYMLAMQRRFPEGCFVDDAHRACRIGRIRLCGPYDVTAVNRSLVYDHPSGAAYPLLKVPIKGIRGTGTVEAANIIADPFGYDVFWMLIQQHPQATFHTADYGHLPISAIEHQKLWSFNFSG